MVERPLEFYLSQAYPFTVAADESGGYFIEYPDLRGCMTQVEDASEIGPMAEEIRRLWLETAHEQGIDIPLPSPDDAWSGRFVVRLPRSLHRRLAESAAREGVSLNTWVTTLLSREEALASAAPAREPLAR